MSVDSLADLAPLAMLSVTVGDAPSPDAPDDAGDPPPLIDVSFARMPRPAAAAMMRQFADVLDPPKPATTCRCQGSPVHREATPAPATGPVRRSPDLSGYAGGSPS